MSPYTHTTLATAKTMLAQRLHDASMVYFIDAELGVYIEEALRTFSLLSMFWRSQETFGTVIGTEFYELHTQFSSSAGLSVSDRDLINTIQYHFQEHVTTAWAGGWLGTAQFIMADVSTALQNARNQFLVDSGVYITRTTPSTGAPSGGRITLADTVMDVRRVAWRSSSGGSTVVTPLWRVDEYQLTAYDTTWDDTADQVPEYYAILASPPSTIQLAPAPTATTTIDLLSVSSGAAFDPTASETVLGVPDDMAWIVKWGAMADLLGKDGPAQDPERAQYCEQRYQQGVQLARVYPLLVAARIGGATLNFASVYEMDSYNINWQTESTDTPTEVLQAGRNMMALYPKPDGVVTITMDIVRNADVPTGDADYIEVGRETLDVILDYAVNLAMFKVAGDEWKATHEGYQNLLEHAALFNKRLDASSLFGGVIAGKPSREENERGRL